jgi:hypothetical protein
MRRAADLRPCLISGDTGLLPVMCDVSDVKPKRIRSKTESVRCIAVLVLWGVAPFALGGCKTLTGMSNEEWDQLNHGAATQSASFPAQKPELSPPDNHKLPTRAFANGDAGATIQVGDEITNWLAVP